MAARYRLSHCRRLLNALVPTLLLVGLGLRRTSRLTVQGRRTGPRYSTPVTLVEEGTHRWLVTPYGEVSWVGNTRAMGRVTRGRRRQSETVRFVDLGPAEAAQALKQYVTDVPITRLFFDAKPDSPMEAYAAEANFHPVFRIRGGAG